MSATVILDPHFRKVNVLFRPSQMDRLRILANIVWARDEPMPEEEVARVAPEVEAIITGGWRYGSVDRFPRLKGILEVGGSFPSPTLLDYDECFRRGIRILSCAPGFAPAVAEMALGLAIASGRGIVEGDAAFRQGEETWGHRGQVQDFLLFDQTVGLIGFGSLARALKALLSPFRCRIQVYDPWLTDAYLQRQGVAPVDLDALLSTSQVLFVLAVPTASNQALLDRTHLERIKPGSVMVLISRAHLVDFDALTEFVLAGRFKAGIDVFPQEPLPEDHPIRKAEGAILSPHRAGGGGQTYHYIGDMVISDLEAILAGHPPMEMQVAQPEYIRNRG